MKLKDINYEIFPSHILCSYRCNDGTLLKKKYIGYSLTEAKKVFHREHKDLD